MVKKVIRQWFAGMRRFGRAALGSVALGVVALGVVALGGAGLSMGANAATVLVYGDSLSAGYGIGQKESWPNLLQERLRQEKFNYTVANASISGETSAGGASRIGAALAQFNPSIVVVELGANDGLRGLPIAQMKANLTTIIKAAQARNAQVLLVGMRMPPNYGQRYTDEFARAFADLAKEHRTGLVPFLLEPIATKAGFFLSDNVHPTAAAQPLLLDHVWNALKPLLKR
jgi:acyl-CoA thioesterase-1